MAEIADLTYNVVAFTEIMQMLWKRLNSDGRYWRHVYKSLLVLEYCIKTGSEKVKRTVCRYTSLARSYNLQLLFSNYDAGGSTM